MAEFSSPISGGIRVARSRVSSSTFSFGNAAAPQTQQVQSPDPTIISLLTRNELALNAISMQLASMGQQMNNFGASLQKISSNIATDSALEQQRQRQKQNQERILAEQQLREGKESIVEKKIQSGLVSPVQKVSAKAQGVLSRLMGFFTTLLGGWLINQGIETIRALGQNNKKKLEDIKNNVLKNLFVIGGIYTAIRTGLFGLVGTTSRVVGKINSAIFGGLFLKPIQALIDAVKGASKKLIPGLGSAAKPASAAAAEGAATAATRSAAGGESRGVLGGLMEGAGGMLKGAVGAIGKRALPFGIGAGLDILGGEDPGRAAAGAGAGVGGAEIGGIVGAPLGPLGILGGSIAGYMITEPLGKSFYDKATGKSPKATTTPTTAKTPTKPSADKESGNKVSQDFSQPPQFGTMNIAPVAGESGADSQAAGITPQSQPTDYSSIFSSTSPISPTTTTTTTTAKIELVKTQTASEKATSVGPLPEPKPNVVVASPPAQSASTPIGGGGGGSANNVPSISASNPDNFYVLYSQMSYNVVT